MSKKEKLELTWIGKENRPKLEPRILLEDPEERDRGILALRAGWMGGRRAVRSWGLPHFSATSPNISEVDAW